MYTLRIWLIRKLLPPAMRADLSNVLYWADIGAGDTDCTTELYQLVRSAQ